MHGIRTGLGALALTGILATVPAAATDRAEQVLFAPGTGSARLEGKIGGEKTALYRLARQPVR